ncbi:MAG: bifunctional folylpolyglutamate synthase/dihydrofolate synthase [Lachnospiraceae bacterium]|nr:bifunctional folylpolyglutamate synthase/dihydrofolate synthase [Lachnospiraceae bacterium]
MDYIAAMDYINNAGCRGIKMGTERMKKLMEYLNNPQDSLKFIHIAGTNGKGSTTEFLASILRQGGYRTGQYLSPAVGPHLEQYRVNGVPMLENEYAKYVSLIAEAVIKMEADGFEAPTRFEIETAIAFLNFKNYICDIVLLETGMGGRDDATNIINTVLVSVITSVSADHIGILGKDLKEIAEIKAGIIKYGVPAVMMHSSDEVEQQIIKRCKAVGTTLSVVDPNLITNKRYGISGQYFSYKSRKNLAIAMGGDHQIENAALALEVCDQMINKGMILAEDEIREGLAQAKLPYRMERILSDPLFIIDGAHNPDAALSLRNSLAHDLMGHSMIFIMGVFKDKDYRRICEIIGPMADSCITVETPDNKRALPAGELAECLSDYCDDIRVSESISDAAKKALSLAEEAVEKLEEPLIVAFGSLSYLDELKKSVRELTDDHSIPVRG